MKKIFPKNYTSSRNEIILNYCKWKKVLHIWACDSPNTLDKYSWNRSPLLYREIDKICWEQLWIDLDKSSIKFLNSKKEFKNSKITFFDMNKLENLDFQPEVIIFWDVIEHLMNLEIALTNLKKVMDSNCLLIISTPNAYCISNFVNNLFWVEFIHEDHKVNFSYWSLSALLNYNNLTEEKFYFTNLDSFTNNLNIYWKISYRFKRIVIFLNKSYADTLLFISKKWN